MYDAILVPTDGNDGASAALDQAFELASTREATAQALYVVDDSRGSSGLMGLKDGKPLEPLREEGEAAVD